MEANKITPEEMVPGKLYLTGQVRMPKTKRTRKHRPTMMADSAGTICNCDTWEKWQGKVVDGRVFCAPGGPAWTQAWPWQLEA